MFPVMFPSWDLMFHCQPTPSQCPEGMHATDCCVWKLLSSSPTSSTPPPFFFYTSSFSPLLLFLLLFLLSSLLHHLLLLLLEGCNKWNWGDVWAGGGRSQRGWRGERQRTRWGTATNILHLTRKTNARKWCLRMKLYLLMNFSTLFLVVCFISYIKTFVYVDSIITSWY